MISLEFVNEFMWENFENVSISRNGAQYLARCPLCGDSKKNKSKRRFNLKFDGDKTVFRCFNCDASGSFKKLFLLIKGEYLADNRLENFNELSRVFSKNDYVKEIKVQKEKVIYNEILKDCIGLEDNIDSIYLQKYQDVLKKFYKNRSISKTHKIFISYHGYFKDRIIIPIYKNNDIVYFQARRIYSDMIPKYKNPSLEKNSFILNEDNFDPDKYIVVTEGILDAYSVGEQGTSCLGLDLSKSYIEKISNLTKIGIIIALDYDDAGFKSVKKYYNKVLKDFYNKINIKYFLMPINFREYKDINKLKVKEKIQNMYEYVVNNSYSYEGYIVRSRR